MMEDEMLKKKMIMDFQIKKELFEWILFIIKFKSNLTNELSSLTAFFGHWHKSFK